MNDAISIDYTFPPTITAMARFRIHSAYEALLEAITAAERGVTLPPVRTKPPLKTWDRAHVLQQIEEASGQSLSAGDSLPDSLIATAQALGLQPHELGVWIYDSPHNWQPGELATWAKRNGFGITEAHHESVRVLRGEVLRGETPDA
jgi:hypothetical protein